MPSFHTRRRVPFTPEQMFDLVADVERYPEFVPLCSDLTVKRRDERSGVVVLLASMSVGYRHIRETFISRVTLDRPKLMVHAEHVDGPFHVLDNRWRMHPAPGGCDVDFKLAYSFKSRMLALLMGSVFDHAFRRFADAFEARARAVYGGGPPEHRAGRPAGEGRSPPSSHAPNA